MRLGGRIEPMRTISRDNVALWASSVLTYRVRDPQKWAIDNLDPQELLQGDCDGIVKDILQASGVDTLIGDRESIRENIFMALKFRPINEGGPLLEEKYGIEVVSFVLEETRFGDKLEKASDEKKRRELMAEAENYAADQEADRIRKLYAAYLESILALKRGLGVSDGSTDAAMLEFLTQQKWAASYEKKRRGAKTVVIRNVAENADLAFP
jgi:regulator of protease activity HflC (stomatin/prohibitin superfamily)